jgi:hypothetical protein
MLYELTMRGTFFNQQIINRWNYVSTGIGASVSGSFGLIDAFGAIDTAGVYPPLKPFQLIMNCLSNLFTVYSLEARAASLYDPEDFYERPFPTPYAGNIAAGQGTSPALAFGMRTTRVRLDIARGTKRFSGVSEDQIDSGGVIASAALTRLASAADAMSDLLTFDDEGNVISYSPCVVGKQEYTTPSGKKAYRYYPTLVEQLTHIATGIVWAPYTTVRTQTSRQYGRGI